MLCCRLSQLSILSGMMTREHGVTAKTWTPCTLCGLIVSLSQVKGNSSHITCSSSVSKVFCTRERYGSILPL